MIAKFTKGGAIKGVLQYHYHKINEGVAHILDTNIYSEDYNKQLKFYLNSFDSALNKSRIKNNFIHASISLSPEENIPENTITELGIEYMEKMGYKDVPYTIISHKDTLHQHIHIIASRIDSKGQTISDTKDYYRNLEQCQILEKKYNLLPIERLNSKQKKDKWLSELNMQKFSVAKAISKNREHDFVKHFANKVQEKYENHYSKKTITKKSLYKYTDKELQFIVGYKDFELFKNQLDINNMIEYSKKHRLENILLKTQKESSSKKEFLQSIHNQNLYVRELRDSNNKPYYTYGLKNESFYVTEKYIDNSLSHTFIENLETNKVAAKTQQDSKTNQKELSTKIKKIVFHSNNINELEYNLKIQNIKFEYSYTNKGETIQGIKFYNEVTGEYINGSKIDRKLSWNNIKSTFINIKPRTFKKR